MQIRLIFKSLENNRSLSTLAANRKNLNDEDIEELCQSLQKNNFLEKLELEYNRITSVGLKKIQEFLVENKTLKHLSLEGNALSTENDDSGIQSLFEGLKKNKTLLFLNLSSTNLDQNCGSYIINTLRQNQSLIMIHLQGNRLSHETMKQIQDLLISNRQKFEKERILETEERKNLRSEMEAMQDVTSALIKKQAVVSEITKSVYEKQQWREKLFFEDQEKTDEADARLMKKLEKDAATRLVRKKRRPQKNKTA